MKKNTSMTHLQLQIPTLNHFFTSITESVQSKIKFSNKSLGSFLQQIATTLSKLLQQIMKKYTK